MGIMNDYYDLNLIKKEYSDYQQFHINDSETWNIGESKCTILKGIMSL